MTDQRAHGAYAETLREGGVSARTHGAYAETLLEGGTVLRAQAVYAETLRSVASVTQTLQVHGLFAEVLTPSALNAAADGVVLSVAVSFLPGAASSSAIMAGDALEAGLELGEGVASASAAAAGATLGVVVRFRPGHARVVHQVEAGDIATAWDPDALAGDWLLRAPQLGSDQGLRTAIVLSLFSDRLAPADAQLPADDGDRRGWWGDLVLEGDELDELGSHLWLLEREKATDRTRARAEAYVRAALAWLVTDGVASSIEVATEWRGEKRDQLAIAIRVNRRGGTVPASSRFDFTWTAEAAR